MNSRKGFSLVLVLTFSMLLLALGSAYLKMNTQNKPVNDRVFEHTQADFLAQGIVQLAVLKFKKRPAEFYYAYKARKSAANPGPFNVYVQSDTSLNGTWTDANGSVYNFYTSWELITNKLFDVDGIRIQVTIEQPRSDGSIRLTRTMEHVIQANRRTL